MTIQLFPIQLDGSVACSLDCTEAVTAQVIEATVGLYRRCGFVSPWTGYLAVENGYCVGSCGFASPPLNNEVEIAYFTFPGSEGRGVATRMAKTLLTLSEPQAEADGLVFIAHTLPHEGPSPAILRKLGFSLLGVIEHPDDGCVWKWLRSGSVEPS